MKKTSERWLALAQIAVFFGLYYASTFLERPIANYIVGFLSPWLPAHQAGQVPPALLIGLCIARVVLVIPLIGVIALWQRKRWSDYGFRPFPLAHLMRGLLAGLVAIGTVHAALIMGGHLVLTGFNVSGSQAVMYGTVWAVGMLLVGFSEEMEFRGVPVLVATMADMPVLAVTISALAFGLVHVGNDGENTLGLIQVAFFGAVAAVSVVRTHSLAFAIGLHAGWNWTLEYLFGAVGSGYTFQGHLLNQQLSGPDWLTGGTAGLEGSVWALLVLVVVMTAMLRRPAWIFGDRWKCDTQR